MNNNSKFANIFLILNFLLFLFSSYNHTKIKIGNSLFYFLKIPILNCLNKIETFYNNYIFFFKENEKLKNKILNLQKENEFLKTEIFLYKNAENHEEINNLNLIEANVVSKCFFSDVKCIYIDAGKDKNIYEGMGVISKNGTVGIIIQTYTNFSKVLLINDANFSIDVFIKPNNIKAILYGLNKKFCKIKYIPLTANVKINDIVVTSGFSEIFPMGIKVGKIVKINQENLYKSALLKPSVNFQNLKTVYVIRK